MKILIKSFYGTYEYFQRGAFESHCSSYYTFLFREIFRQLGHTCDFIGSKELKNEIYTDASQYDMILFWGLESFVFDREFSTNLLTNFKGKKCLYITAKIKDDIINHFDYIFPCEIFQYKTFYETNYPKARTSLVNFASPFYYFVDKDPQVINNEAFKVIYTGIITGRSKILLNRLAERGVNLYVGGIYAPPDGKGCRPLSSDEIKNEFNSNIHWLSDGGNFPYGSHFKYLKTMDIGLNFYPIPKLPSLPINSKIVDYLVCGLPIICEDASPNNFRIKDLNAGYIVKWNNIEEIYQAIQKAQSFRFDRENIQTIARQIFDPIKVGQQIMEVIQ